MRNKYSTTAETLHYIEYSFGISIEELRNFIGKPHFQCKLEQLPDYSILIYEKKIVGINLLFEFHFFRNRLFFFNKAFPESYYCSSNELELLEMFCQKYSIPEGLSISDLLICDPSQHCVFVELDNRFTICNLAGKSKIFTELLEIIWDFPFFNKVLKNFLNSLTRLI